MTGLWKSDIIVIVTSDGKMLSYFCKFKLAVTCTWISAGFES